MLIWLEDVHTTFFLTLSTLMGQSFILVMPVVTASMVIVYCSITKYLTQLSVLGYHVDDREMRDSV